MADKVDIEIRQPGMGATPGARGVTFRVWAPHAETVFVTGTFNAWNQDVSPLSKEKNGNWSTVIPAAKTGDEYRFLIQGSKGLLSRIDPYARKVTNSIGNGVIYDPKAFDWGDNKFQIATGNELVIYEMHIGTFNVKEKGRPGTFDSAREKLPYLQKLGVNAI
jgi:1,4-alpha-glucan branching enzyme